MSQDDTSRDKSPVTCASNVIYYSSGSVAGMELHGMGLPGMELHGMGLPGLVNERRNEPVDVEMEERWAEDEELMMDVDMTTELQQEVYQQVLLLYIT